MIKWMIWIWNFRIPFPLKLILAIFILAGVKTFFLGLFIANDSHNQYHDVINGNHFPKTSQYFGNDNADDGNDNTDDVDGEFFCGAIDQWKCMGFVFRGDDLHQLSLS